MKETFEVMNVPFSNSAFPLSKPTVSFCKKRWNIDLGSSFPEVAQLSRIESASKLSMHDHAVPIG